MRSDGGKGVVRQCDRLGNTVCTGPEEENSAAKELRGLNKMREIGQISEQNKPLNTLERLITQ